ncbi:ArsR family transcriptional regulator [Demequina sp. NBRC 110052]|uniref:arsenate reductase/protein-tyrosine-phosphatase family protein n=1 Tax=Demequina sp. NBRC 110052 TaxID=1570341 RepID=UPI000A027A09|nr:ArsR family transcriptional regulator [Demequina sp. NBRC 110052]
MVEAISGDNERLARRATIHGALADPQRLRIVDSLATRDLAPGELGDLLGLSSSLLAHHLKTLEAARIVRRRRSDGDGRRNYVSLRWDDAVVAATAAASRHLDATRVVFVCTENSARSQMAAALLASRGTVQVGSAGTHPGEAIHPRALAQIDAHGLAPVSARPATLESALRPGDLVIAVCDNAYEELDDEMDLLHWSVPDPAASPDPDAFASSFESLERRVGRLADSLA